MYHRVIPRDLFNEGKLLTELGFLSLCILDNVQDIGSRLKFEHDGAPFEIVQCTADGSFSVDNLHLMIKPELEDKIYLYTPLNHKEENALMFCFNEIEGTVFEGKNLSSEFLEMVSSIKI